MCSIVFEFSLGSLQNIQRMVKLELKDNLKTEEEVRLI